MPPRPAAPCAMAGIARRCGRVLPRPGRAMAGPADFPCPVTTFVPGTPCFMDAGAVEGERMGRTLQGRAAHAGFGPSHIGVKPTSGSGCNRVIRLAFGAVILVPLEPPRHPRLPAQAL